MQVVTSGNICDGVNRRAAGVQLPAMRIRLTCGLMTLLAALTCTGAPALQAAGPPHSILLPPVLVAQAPATLAVLDADGQLVPGAAVALGDGITVKTDATGRARFRAPGEAESFEARIPGTTITASAPIGVRPAVQAIQVTEFPPMIDAQAEFTIYGIHFSGDADVNRVSLGGKAAAVLAASPAALVLLPAADTPLGAGELRVEGDVPAAKAVDVTVVEIDAINPAGPLRIGQPATLTVRVQGSTQPVDVELGNWSPAVIKMLPQTDGAAAESSAASDPNVRRVRTSGGDQNEAKIEIVPLAAGKFFVRARLAQQQP
jgi:hypothetical protein